VKRLYSWDNRALFADNMDHFIFKKKADQQYYVNWFYFWALLISIPVVLSLYILEATWGWEELLYDKYDCLSKLNLWVMYPTSEYSLYYTACKNKTDVSGSGMAFLYSIMLAICTAFIYYLAMPLYSSEQEYEEFLVTKKVYYLTILYLIFTIICAIMALDIFHSQADEFYSSLPGIDEHEMPNWWLINSLLILPTLLPIVVFMSRYSEDKSR
jgi:hypothetical protein